MLAADDPGLGFGTGKQAELVVLMEQADVGARGSIVASAQVVVDFKVGGGDGKGLGLVAKAPAAASSALEIGRQDPIVASIRAAATKTYLPGQWREKGVPRAQGADFHAGKLFQLKFVVVGIQARVESEELQLGTGTVAGRRVQHIVVGRAQGQLGEFPVCLLACSEAQSEGVVALIIPNYRFGWFLGRCDVADLAALSQQVMGEWCGDFTGPTVGLALVSNIIVGGIQNMCSLLGWQ